MVQLLGDEQMIQTLQLKGYSRARVWIDELPGQALIRGSTKRLYESSGRNETVSRGFAAVEWHIPLGPRSLYGLLGIEYTPLEGELVVDVMDETPSRQCGDSLTSQVSDHPLVGLSSEYWAAALKGILEGFAKDGKVMSGRLLISASVVGEVNSCEGIFENLGRVVTALLCASSVVLEGELHTLLIYK